MKDQDQSTPEVTDEQAAVLDAAGEKLTEDDIRDASQDAEAEVSEKVFTQAELDRIVADRLAREKTQREKAATKAREEAEAKALEEQKEYQQLAEKRQQKIADLEAEVQSLNESLSELEPKAKKYQETLEKRLEAEMEGVPEHIQSLLADRDPVDQLDWLTENREQVSPQEERPTGSRPSPQPSGQPIHQTDKEAKEDARARIGGVL